MKAAAALLLLLLVSMISAKSLVQKDKETGKSYRNALTYMFNRYLAVNLAVNFHASV